MNSVTNAQTRDNTKTRGIFTPRSLTVIAMLSAVAVVLMYFEVPLWFAPNFYRLDFSEAPVLIGAFALGPVAGIMIELVKVLLNLVTEGTQTMAIGEFANFLIGCALVVPAAILYQKKKSRKSALLGLGIGSICMIIIGSVLNAFLLLPVYAYFYGMPINSLVGMGTAVNPSITNLSTFILFAVAPFNLLKSVAVSAVTILLYKRLSKVIKSFTN